MDKGLLGSLISVKNYNDFDKEKKNNCGGSCKDSNCTIKNKSSLQIVVSALTFFPRKLISGLKAFWSFVSCPEKYSIVFRELNAHGFYTLLAVFAAIFFVKLVEGVSVFYNLAISWPLMFHSSHYAHTFFASTTATLVSLRFSRRLFKSVLVGFLVPPFFCTTSDIFMPYLGGKILNIPMKLHLCIFHNAGTLLTFMATGVLFGVILHYWAKKNLWIVGISSHFLHDFVSTVASLAYLISYGYKSWWSDLPLICCLMVVAVAIPCMISDLVLPILISVESAVWKKNETCCK